MSGTVILGNFRNTYNLANTHSIDDEFAPAPLNNDIIRQFPSGATRNSDLGKLDYDGFLSPTVLKSYALYMHKMRYLENGDMRDSDNWQKGIPKSQYLKSMWRHFMSVWTESRFRKETKPHCHNSQEAYVEQLNALLFNVMGLLHEELKSS